jgi:5-methylcytosine-specific restriction endonuclease McrA
MLNKHHFPGMTGRHHSAETKAKMREARLGKSSSAETRKKISAARRVQTPPNLGKHFSDEYKQKMSSLLHGKFPGRPSPFRGKHHSEESKRKSSEAHRGELSSFWRGGISYEPYSTDWTETLKRSIRERDHYTCQSCGIQQGDIAFDVHHIDANKKNCDPANLVTLCHKCHSKVTVGRK